MIDVIQKIEPFVGIIMNVYVHRCAGLVIATGYEDRACAVAELNSSQCPWGLLNIIGVTNYTISIQDNTIVAQLVLSNTVVYSI